MKNNKVYVTADQLKKRKKITRLVMICILILFIVLFATYAVLSLVNNGGNFTVELSDDLASSNRITIYDDKGDFDFKKRLYAEGVDTMDNISIDWLPADIDTEADGSHNGENYLAYSFYVENRGDDTVNYWSEMFIDDVIKNIDEAIRVMIIQNGEKTVYAKSNSTTGEPEEGTTAFRDSDKIIIRPRYSFAPGDIDRYTIVIWLEGDDEDCVNSLIGGEIKMHMEITDELVSEGD